MTATMTVAVMVPLNFQNTKHVVDLDFVLHKVHEYNAMEMSLWLSFRVNLVAVMVDFY
jgi:hypothetical protein